MNLAKIAIKDFKKAWLLNSLVLFLLISMFLIATSITCSIQQKIKNPFLIVMKQPLSVMTTEIVITNMTAS